MVIIFVSIMIMLKYADFIARLVKFIIIIISLKYLDCSYMIRIN
jgi:hypothetical protein